MFEFNKDKILPFDALINRIHESFRDFKEKKQQPKLCLFLGAGCSISSNVKKASEIIEFCKKIAFVKIAKGGHAINKYDEIELINFITERNDEFERFVAEKLNSFKLKNESERKDFISTLPVQLKGNKTEAELWSLYEDFFFNDALYSNWFQAFAQDIDERQKLIESLIDDKNPRGAYIFLAYLIKNGVFKNIFTTNFDDLLNDALLHYTNLKSKVYAHNEIAKYIDFNGQKPNIIKLHGDYLFQNIKNTIGETNALAENMNEKLMDALSKFKLDIVIVGYNGSDYSVMKCLREIKELRQFGLYWCARNEDSLHWRVKDLINTTNNSYFVKISSFESFIAKVYNEVNVEPEKSDLLNILATQRNDERIKFTKDYIEDIDQDIEVKEQEKIKIEETLSIRLTDNSFLEVNALPDLKAKINYLSKLRIDGVSRIIKNIYTNIDKQSANELYENLDDGKFFQDKIKEAPIQHIGNALCNLSPVNDIRTHEIFKSIPNEVFIDKFKPASSGEVMSALNEFSSIDMDKATQIGKLVPPKVDADLNKTPIREFSKAFTKANRFSAIKILEAYSDEDFAKRLLREDLKEIAIALEKFYTVSPHYTAKILEAISNDNLLSKVEGCTFLQLANAINKFQAISITKAKVFYKSIKQEVLSEKMDKSGLRDISIALAELGKIDRDKTHKLFIDASDTMYSHKIKDHTFIELAHAFKKFDNLNNKKTGFILRNTPKTIFITKLNEDKSRFEEIGSALLNIIGINKEVFSEVIKESNIVSRAEEFAQDCGRIGEQAFMTYFPACIDIHFELACEIVKRIGSKFFIDLTLWGGLDQYTTSLLKLFDLFDKLKMSEHAKIVASFICLNSDKLKARYNDVEIAGIKKRLSAHYKCP